MDYFLYIAAGLLVIAWGLRIWLGGKYFSKLKEVEKQPERSAELAREFRIRKRIPMLFVFAAIVMLALYIFIS